jgi:hypothetical protein
MDPIFDLECSTVERPPFHASTGAGLRRCSRSFYRGIVSAHNVVLDGRAVKGGYTTQSPVYSFTMPAHDNYLDVRGATHGKSDAYGPVLLLTPLKPGQHTLSITFPVPHHTVTAVMEFDVSDHPGSR